MIITLFEEYNDNAKEILRSLETAHIPTKYFFIRYKGSLPQNSLCPFTYFTQIDSEDKGELFFNQVVVPLFYEIRDIASQYALILDGDKIIGKIHYREGSFRKVDKVRWFSSEKQVTKEDLYNRSGDHYASNFYVQGNLYQTVYLMGEEEILWENHINQLITLKYMGKIYQFRGLLPFTLFFFKIIGLSSDEYFIINSLSYPLFVIREFLSSPRATLFWQEEFVESIPENMSTELTEHKALSQIIFKDETQLEKVKAACPIRQRDLHYLSPIGQFLRENHMRLTTFTLTASDQLNGIEELLSIFPDISFCIAAKTSMSRRLLDLGRKHPNLRLKPNISNQEISTELNLADIYLDINQGIEVESIIKKAYHNALLIFADSSCVKSGKKSIVFDNLSELKLILAKLSQSKENWLEVLAIYHQKNGRVSTENEYRRLFDFI